MMRRLIPAILLVLVAFAIVPRAKADPYLPYHGWCEDGNQKVVTSGLNSTTKVQASYPQCTITVFLHGGVVEASIYSDSTGTPLANPTTAETNGQIIWYAAPGRYDMQMSGAGFPVPVTIEDITLGSTPSSPTGGIQVNTTPTLNSIAPFYGNFSDTVPAAPAGYTNCLWQTDNLNPTDISCYVPSVTGGIQLNGTATLHSVSPYFGNFNSTTPAAPAGAVNVIFQRDASDPNNISAYLPSGALSATPYVELPSSTFNCGSGDSGIVLGQSLCTMNIAALAQGNTAQSPFIAQPSGFGLFGPPFVGTTATVEQTASFYPNDSTNGTSISETWPNNFQTMGLTDETMYVIWEEQGAGGMDPCTTGGTVTDNKGDTYSRTPQTSSGYGDICLAYAFNVPAGVTSVTLSNTGGGSSGWTNAEVYLLDVVGPTSLDVFGNYGGTNAPSPQSVTITTTANNDFAIEVADNAIADANLQCWPTSLTQDNLAPFASLDHPCLGSVAKNLFTTNQIAVGQFGSAGSETQHTAWQKYNRNGFFVAAFKAAGTATTAVPWWQLPPTVISTTTNVNAQPGWVNTVNGFSASTCSGGTTFLAADGNCYPGAFDGGLGASFQDVTETAAPANPATGNDRLYLNSTTHLLSCLTSSGASCMPASGVSSVDSLTGAVLTSASAPIVQTISGQTINFSCPTCSGGSALPAASPNLKTAAPVEIPGTTVVYSPDPNIVIGSLPTGDITSASPSRPLIAGHAYGIYFFGSENMSSVATCTISPDSLGNTYTRIQITPSDLFFFSSSITTAGTPVFTPSAGCNEGPSVGFQQEMAFVDLQNASAVDASAGYGPDSCGSLATRCVAIITTTQPSDLVLDFLNIPTNTSTNGQITTSPQGSVFSNSVGSPSYQSSAVAASSAGTYTFTATTYDNNASYLGGIVVAIAPRSPLVGTAVIESQTSVTTLTSITYSQTVTSGNTLEVSVSAPSMTTPASCLPTDTLGNTFVNLLGTNGTNNRWYAAPVTTGGASDTISFPAACSNSSASAEVAMAMQVSGSVTTVISYGTAGSNVGTYSPTTSQDNATLVLFPINAFNNVSYTFSPGLDVLASSGTINSYALAIGQLSPPGAYTYLANGNNNFSQYGGVILYPNTQPTYPQQPRVTQLADIGAPVTTLTLPFASTLTFNGAQAHGWDVTLTGNVTTTNIAGFTGGQNYEFTFCQDAYGSHSVAAPTDVNVTNWPNVNGAANACTSAHATYDGASSTLVFPPATPTMCISPASPAACGSATSGYVTVAAGSTTETVDTTAVGANSVISLTNTSASQVASALGVTANTTAALPSVTDQTSGTSFQITLPSAPATNPNIYEFNIINPIQALLDPPPVTSGLVWHVDINQQGCTNAAAVPTLNDFGTTGANATSSTGATCNTAAINSRSAVLFPGTSAGEYNFSTISTNSGFTVFMVFEDLTTGTESDQLTGSGTSIDANGVANSLRLGLGSFGVDVTSAATLANATWYQANISYNSTSGAWAWRINEAASASGTATTGVGANWSAFGYRPGGPFDSNLKVAETLIYNRALSAAEISAVETWLHGKYGI